METKQISALLKRVLKSTFLTDAQKDDWKKRMEIMNDEELNELSGLLDEAENIDMETELSLYENAIENAAEFCDTELSSMDQFLSSYA